MGFGVETGGSPLGSRWRELDNLSASHLALELSCGAQGEGECPAPYQGPPPSPQDLALFEQLDIVLRDDSPPVVTRSELSRVNSAVPVSGTLDLATAFTDRGGGVAYAELLVDGAVYRRLDPAGAPCGKPYTQPVPCAVTGHVDALLDTAALADGAHNVELRLFDAAGNRAVLGPVLALVRNTQPSLAHVTRPGRVSLQRASFRIAYGATRRLEGVVTDLDGAPIPGTTVQVASRDRGPAARFVTVATPVTDARGRFTVPISTGPSRTFQVRYADSEATAEVVVRAPLRLRATPTATQNGKSVRFVGSIPGVRNAGVRVELQAWAGRWVPFRTASVRNGRFSARYRFTRTTVKTRYRVRAVVRADPDLPYAAGTSKVLKVLVRP